MISFAVQSFQALPMVTCDYHGLKVQTAKNIIFIIIIIDNYIML